MTIWGSPRTRVHSDFSGIPVPDHIAKPHVGPSSFPLLSSSSARVYTRVKILRRYPGQVSQFWIPIHSTSSLYFESILQTHQIRPPH